MEAHALFHAAAGKQQTDGDDGALASPRLHAAMHAFSSALATAQPGRGSPTRPHAP